MRGLFTNSERNPPNVVPSLRRREGRLRYRRILHRLCGFHWGSSLSKGISELIGREYDYLRKNFIISKTLVRARLKSGRPRVLLGDVYLSNLPASTAAMSNPGDPRRISRCASRFINGCVVCYSPTEEMVFCLAPWGVGKSRNRKNLPTKSPVPRGFMRLAGNRYVPFFGILRKAEAPGLVLRNT